jgi:curved DNA-binding protein CbpA
MKSYSQFLFIFLFLFFLSSSFSYQIAPGQPMPTMPQPGGLPPELTMTEEEWNQVFEYLSTLDEKQLKELEEYGRQVLTDVYGLDPDTLQPLPGGPKNPQQPPPAPQMPPLIEKKEPERPFTTENKNEVRSLIKGLITKSTSLRTKITLLPAYEVPAFTWLNQLNSLIIYLSSLDKNDHYEHLLLPEFSSLLENLKYIYKTLSTYEPLLAIDDIAHCETPCTTDDPYEILGISPRASTHEIEEAFQKLAQVKNPEIVKQKLQDAQKLKRISQKDVSRALKEALLSFSIIQDAYEKLKDPKIRQYIDRERVALQGQTEQTRSNMRQAFTYLDQSLTKAFTQLKILNQIETFLKKYEPQELARKKELLDAQAKRHQEQELLSKLKPSPTPGGPYEKNVARSFYPEPFNQLGYGNPSPFPSYEPKQSFPPAFQPEKPSIPPTREEKPSLETGPKKEKTEKTVKSAQELEEKKDKDKKVTEKKIKAQTAKYQKKTTDILKELEKDCTQLQEYLKKSESKNFLTELDLFLHDQITSSKKYPTQKPQQIMPTLPPRIELEEVKTSISPLEPVETQEISPKQKEITEPIESTLPETINTQEEDPELVAEKNIITLPEESVSVEVPLTKQETLPSIFSTQPTELKNQVDEQAFTKELENKEKSLEKFLKESNLLKFDEDLIKLKEVISKEGITTLQKQETLQKWYPWYMKCQPTIKQLENQFKDITAPISKKNKPINTIKEKFLSGNSVRPGLLRIAYNTIDRINKTIEEIDKILRKQR